MRQQVRNKIEKAINEWEKATSNEKDSLLAEIFQNWDWRDTVCEGHEVRVLMPPDEPASLLCRDDWFYADLGNSHHALLHKMPRFSTTTEAVLNLETKIGDIGLSNEYVYNLKKLCEGLECSPDDAGPDTRCLAALYTVRRHVEKLARQLDG